MKSSSVIKKNKLNKAILNSGACELHYFSNSKPIDAQKFVDDIIRTETRRKGKETLYVEGNP